MRGYVAQYRAAAAAIYASLDQGDLHWVEVASRPAGIADDLVLGFECRIVGHQFKTAQTPGRFRVRTLLMGADGLLAPLASGWKGLRTVNPGATVEIRLVTNEVPAGNDSIIAGTAGTSSESFLNELRVHRSRSLVGWHATPWAGFIGELHRASGLTEPEFEAFLQGFQLLSGPEADFIQLHRLNAYGARQAAEIAEKLPQLVAEGAKERWSRSQFLAVIGWRDSAATRLLHRFPVGPYVQRNARTEQSLVAAIASVTSGYIALIGPPGVGKSTLLQTALLPEEKLSVVRYLAYVPGMAQGVGRGEADSFLDDLGGQLRSSGLRGIRFRNDTLYDRREQFGALLVEAGDRFVSTGVRTVIVVDGLDHVPREEQPVQSMLGELPGPSAVPPGVIFVLGTQRLELPGLKPSVKDQAALDGRRVDVFPLPQPVIEKMAEQLGLDPDVPRARVSQVSQGHPLVARYLIEALREQDERGRRELLDGGFAFTGDLEALYASAWRGVEGDEHARLVLDFLGRAEGAMPLELLAQVVSEQAIERALKAAKHLLQVSAAGWSVFHNSFRLYIIAKPKMRLGREDMTHSATVYRQLAQLAAAAPATTAQRWQELRYRARAFDDAAVLDLATQSRLRTQLLDGRSDAELHVDFRLALKAALRMGDPTAAIRMLLITDEVSRRADALAESSWFIRALLAASPIESAIEFARDYDAHGLPVVDVLLESGDRERAEALFDHLDPVVQALSGRLQYSGTPERSAAFLDWASRLLFFRESAQVEEAIARLVAHHRHGGDRPDGGTDDFETQVRYQMLLGFLAQFPKEDAASLLEKYGKDEEWLPDLLVRAGLSHLKRGNKLRAVELFSSARQLPTFHDIPSTWLVPVARAFLEAGQTPVATEVFQKAPLPSFADLDGTYDEESAAHCTNRLIAYFALAAQLDVPLPSPADPQKPKLATLQNFIVKVGTALGKARKWASAKNPEDAAASGSAQFLASAQTVLTYLAREQPQSPDFFVHGRIRNAAEVLCPALIETAKVLGPEAFAGVVRKYEDAVAQALPRSALSRVVQQEVAHAIYRVDGDAENAAARLEPHISALVESTPAQQLDGLARLAVAYANAGLLDRARQLIRQALEQTLGTALTARKDASYSTWMEVLRLANAADGTKRRERTSALLRQAIGMSKTEGEAASQRMATLLVEEATWGEPAFGLSAARALLDVDSIEWPWLTDALLRGTIQRRPDLAPLCGVLWCRLAMPYLKAPHYESEGVVGGLPTLAIARMDSALVPAFVASILPAIESQARPDGRCAILREVIAACKKRDIEPTEANEALIRWTGEAPLPRQRGTPDKYDDISNLAALQAAAIAEGSSEFAGTSLYGPFIRLAEQSGYAAARAAFEAMPALHGAERAIFALADLAMDAGDLAYAKSLVDGYRGLPGTHGTWTQMFSGDAQRYFRARIRLEGPPAHEEAFKDLVESIHAGRENTRYLAWDIENLLPIITPRPDWLAVWELIEQQLRASREFNIASEVALAPEIAAAVVSEEHLLAELVAWSFDIPAGELNYQARVAMLQSLSMQGGPRVFELTARTLLASGGDGPAHALSALLLDTGDTARAALLAEVQAAATSEDLTVAAFAGELCRRWGFPVALPSVDLPALYHLSLPPHEHDDTDASKLFRDSESGAMRAEYPGGWTEHLDFVVEPLVRGSVEREHIELRCKLLIDRWAGDQSAIEAFGHEANKRRQVELAQLGMRLKFRRPNVEVAVRALGVVAGDLFRAGLLRPKEVRTFLSLLGWEPAGFTLLVPASIPASFVRPTMPSETYGQGDEEQAWVDRVADDLALADNSGNRTILAEVTKFSKRQAHYAEYKVERIRARVQLDPDEGLSDWVRQLPAAAWRDGSPVCSPPASEAVVRPLYMGPLGRLPFYQLVVCPQWAARLRWSLDPQNRTLYRDSSGSVVAQLKWWRDGGPQDVQEDAWWAEGFLVELTLLGKSQLEAVTGPIAPLRSISRRSAKLLREHGRHPTRTAAN